jgi:hypothetical protein
MANYIVQCANWPKCKNYTEPTFRGPDICGDCEKKEKDKKHGHTHKRK